MASVLDTRDDPIPVIHVDGLDHIEILAEGRGLFCLYKKHRLEGGGFLLLPRIDIEMPLGSLPDAIRKCMAVSATELAGKVYRFIPLSMH